MGTKRGIPKGVEKALFQEANSRCLICGNDDVSVLMIHHIIPFSKNPEHKKTDMLVLCANCHAKADRGEIARDTLYAAKARRTKIIPFPGARSPAGRISVSGTGNVVAGRDLNINGGLHIKLPKGTRSSRAIVPGTVAEDARMLGYLNYLVSRYQEFKKWACDQAGEPMNYARIHVAYKRKIKYKVRETPRDLFDAAVNFLQGRIENTKLGRIQRSRGQDVYSSFETFDKQGKDT